MLSHQISHICFPNQLGIRVVKKRSAAKEGGWNQWAMYWFEMEKEATEAMVSDSWEWTWNSVTFLLEKSNKLMGKRGLKIQERKQYLVGSQEGWTSSNWKGEPWHKEGLLFCQEKVKVGKEGWWQFTWWKLGDLILTSFYAGGNWSPESGRDLSTITSCKVSPRPNTWLQLSFTTLFLFPLISTSLQLHFYFLRALHNCLLDTVDDCRKEKRKINKNANLI